MTQFLFFITVRKGGMGKFISPCASIFHDRHFEIDVKKFRKVLWRTSLMMKTVVSDLRRRYSHIKEQENITRSLGMF